MNYDFDIAVIGSGYAGSLMAMIAGRLSYRVALIEKGSHPRVVVGESSTPLSNLILEELAIAYDLPMLLPLTKWGNWQRQYSQLGCGLKRGFSFLHHRLGEQATSAFPTEAQLMVAASPSDEVADTHWFRADVDQFLVEQTQALGITYFDACSIGSCTREQDTWKLSGTRNTSPIEIAAAFLIDATGPRGFLFQALGLTESPLPNYPQTASLHCHFRNVGRLANQTSCQASLEEPDGAPFPLDDAAVHHIFEGGWIWVLRFNNGWTSAGVAATGTLATRLRLSEGAPAWHRLLNELPRVKTLFANAAPILPFTYIPRLSFSSDSIVGDGWAMLPSAAGFTDPLLSTGFPLTLLGVQRLAEALSTSHSIARLSDHLQPYARQTRIELAATGKLIGSLYSNMHDFQLFRTLSLLYFAAASYSETARRLHKSERANSFLLADNPDFSTKFNRITELAQGPLHAAQKRDLQSSIYRLIEKFDVAGLCKHPANHWYPVHAQDLVDSSYKLDATKQEIAQLLARCGFKLRSA